MMAYLFKTRSPVCPDCGKTARYSVRSSMITFSNEMLSPRCLRHARRLEQALVKLEQGVTAARGSTSGEAAARERAAHGA